MNNYQAKPLKSLSYVKKKKLYYAVLTKNVKCRVIVAVIIQRPERLG